MGDSLEVGAAVRFGRSTCKARRCVRNVHASCVAWLACALLASHSAFAASYTLIVSGLGGEPQYEERFRENAEEIATSAQGMAEAPEHVVTLTGANATRTAIRRELKALATRVRQDDMVTLVLIGHGTYDGEEYRFNVPGRDITGSELRELLGALRAREQLIVNTTSASGATIDQWASPGRVLITATKSGGERTATRFAQYWAEALKNPAADTNKDEIITASEAYEYASRQVAAAFKADVALATEHARIEGLDAANNLAVALLGASAVLSSDPEVRAMLAERASLEAQIEELKARRGALAEETYYDELEAVLVKFARLQREIDTREGTAQVSP